MAEGVPTWEEVAREHGRFLYNVAYRLAGNEEDAQDLVQEALIRVRRGLERYEPGSLEGWLARIVTNVFLDEVRRRRRRPTDPLPDDPGRVLPPAPAADEASTQLSEDIQAALGALPDEFRVPVVLCDVSDLSYEEIAAAVGAPIGTVRSRIHRGRRMLRAALMDAHGDGRDGGREVEA
jgi:RNA polymerase sigma-70 factor (ECF subfamily)